MKTIKYTLATLMVALVVAVVFVGCKKEKISIQPNDEGKNVIATMINGQMNYLISVENMQAKIDAYTYNTKNTDRYIIEDWHIENGDGTPQNPLTLVISIMDVEKEEVTTHYFMNECLVTEQIDGITKYYINQDLMDGEYEMFNYTKESVENGKANTLHLKNGKIVGSEEEPIINQPGHPFWHVSCTPHFCQSICKRMANPDGNGGYIYGCDPCQMPAPGHGPGEGEAHDAWCQANPINWWDIISKLLEIGFSAL